MSDPTRDLWMAALTILALAALGIACALWWRLNEMTRPPVPVEQPAPAAPLVDEPPTTPIDDAIDRQLAKFTFDGGRRP